MRSQNLLVAALAIAAAAPAPAQQLAANSAVSTAAGTARADATIATAARVSKPPVIDGRADETIWASAQVIQGFRVFDPSEDGDPRFKTEARVAYDERNLYVLVRAFDPHPDNIRALLARRDARTASDEIKILIDSYHDKRSGFEFAFNPAGVK